MYNSVDEYAQMMTHFCKSLSEHAQQHYVGAYDALASSTPAFLKLFKAAQTPWVVDPLYAWVREHLTAALDSMPIRYSLEHIKQRYVLILFRTSQMQSKLLANPCSHSFPQIIILVYTRYNCCIVHRFSAIFEA